MALSKIDESQIQLKVFNAESLKADFAPWKRSERGQQVYIKLVRGAETAFLFVGENCVLDAEMQQVMLRLVNEGWNVAGEVTMSFEGSSDPGIDPYVYEDPVTLELGRGLLALLDPHQGSPLVEAMPKLRDEIAHESGLVPAGIHLKDNLKLQPSQYSILLKNSPIAEGELFLDRFMAIGSFEQLSAIEGWATVEPTYRMKAKWIEPSMREKAEAAGCILVGPMQVLLTHIKNIMLEAAPELLGLQDTFNLVSRLQITHPVVVEEFLKNRRSLRILRRVLQRLLSERVALSNLVTILETAGDKLDDDCKDDEEIAEACRLALARQICWANLSHTGELQVLMTGAKLEKALENLKENPGNSEEFEKRADELTACIKEGLREAGNPPVIVTARRLRVFLAKLIAEDIPHMCVLSEREAAAGRAKLIVNATAELKDKKQAAPQEQPEQAKDKDAGDEPAKEEAKENKKSEGFLGIFKGGKK